MNGDHDSNCRGGLDNADVADVGAVADVPRGTTLRVPFGETDLTLANVDGKVFAIVDLCLRCSTPLSAAALRGSTLTCLHCGWQYDLERGEVVGLPALRLETHAVRIADGRVLLGSEDATVPGAVTR